MNVFFLYHESFGEMFFKQIFLLYAFLSVCVKQPYILGILSIKWSRNEIYFIQ